jgi:hypothetical protein
VVTVITNSNPVLTYTTNTNAVTYLDPNGNSASNYTISTITNTNAIIVYQTNVVTTNYIQLNQEASTAYNDAVNFMGSYNGGLQNAYPNQTFNANGQVTQTQLSFDTNGIPATVMQNYSITVQGILISSTMQTFPAYSNSVPYATTVYGQTNLGRTN